ncbi:MAG: hypothetical protein ABIG68_02865 [Acidobacteriota bacterium]
MDDGLIIIVGVIAVALILQAVALIVISLAIRRVSERIDTVGKELVKRMDTLSGDAHETFVSVRSFIVGMNVIRDNLAETTSVLRGRMGEIDELLQETAQTARLQIAAIHDFFDGSIHRIEETFEAVQRGLLDPIRDLGALISGIRAAVDSLLRRRSRPLDRFKHDEEMFI